MKELLGDISTTYKKNKEAINKNCCFRYCAFVKYKFYFSLLGLIEKPKYRFSLSLCATTQQKPKQNKRNFNLSSGMRHSTGIFAQFFVFNEKLKFFFIKNVIPEWNIVHTIAREQKAINFETCIRWTRERETHCVPSDFTENNGWREGAEGWLYVVGREEWRRESAHCVTFYLRRQRPIARSGSGGPHNHEASTLRTRGQ